MMIRWRVRQLEPSAIGVYHHPISPFWYNGHSAEGGKEESSPTTTKMDDKDESVVCATIIFMRARQTARHNVLTKDRRYESNALK